MLLTVLLATALTDHPLPPADARALRQDVAFLVRTVETTHPAPFTHLTRRAFETGAAAIERDAGRMTLGEATARLMELVARLDDGHTYVNPINQPGLERWYPIRLYAFPDGLYVTAAAPEYAALVGKRVVSLGGLDAATALARAVALQAANNALAAREGTVWLSNAGLARARGAAGADSMIVTVADSTGARTRLALRPFEAEINDAWNQQGEMFGPRRRQDAQAYVTAFGGRGPLDYRKNDAALPPHLRYRLPYFLVEFPEKKTLYFQWNFIQDWPTETFESFTRRLFEVLDAHPDWRLVVDVRYCSGGDGSRVPAVIRQIVKRDRFDAPGRLFVISGRKSFSAAVDFVCQARQWTSAILVGEPTGAGMNAYGDAKEFKTPRLGIGFQVSTDAHAYGGVRDTSGTVAPDIPAIMTARKYFAGRDPALEAILDGGERELLPLPALGVRFGGAAFETAYRERMANWSGIPWWVPSTERAMNTAAYQALKGGHAADAVVMFRVNTERYPASSNTWASLGDGERATGNLAAAKTAYERALALYPGDDDSKRAIAEMEQTGR